MKYDKFKFSSRADLDKNNRIEKMLTRPISIPGEYLLSGKANDGDKIFWQFLNLLSDTYGESWWKQKNIIKITGLSESKIKRNIRKLKIAGWLETSKLKREISNKYSLIWPASCPNPRIVGAKKNLEMKDMQTKIKRSEYKRYYRNNGFKKAF